MQTFRSELIAALRSTPKSISPKWFYDAEGSRLFEMISELEEYYPTRQETDLLKSVIPDWLASFGISPVLVELGSGASEKTRILLDAIPDLKAYVPLDISPAALDEATQRLGADYPALDIRPVIGDFLDLPDLPADLQSHRKIGFFPGSTLGNLDRNEAVSLLRSSRRMLGDDSCFVLGVDLIKDRATLERAYDDPAGVTAAFNKNLLVRSNRELGTDFMVDRFSHKAVWNEQEARIEMHLVASEPMTINLDGATYRFMAGETLHTESSRKFDEERVGSIADEAGWSIADFRRSDAPSVGLFRLEPKK